MGRGQRRAPVDILVREREELTAVGNAQTILEADPRRRCSCVEQFFFDVNAVLNVENGLEGVVRAAELGGGGRRHAVGDGSCNDGSFLVGGTTLAETDTHVAPPNFLIFAMPIRGLFLVN